MTDYGSLWIAGARSYKTLKEINDKNAERINKKARVWTLAFREYWLIWPSPNCPNQKVSTESYFPQQLNRYQRMNTTTKNLVGQSLRLPAPRILAVFMAKQA